MERPFAGLAAFLGLGERPDFDLAAEADAGGCGAGAAARGAHVVAAEFVGVGDGLLEREGRVGGAVDAEG